MKKLKLSLMLFLAVLVSGSTMANGILNVDVIPGINEKALVDITNAGKNKYEVVLKDSNGEVVYIDKIKTPTSNYQKLYDFSDLNNGRYTFSVKMGNETELTNIAVNNGKAKIVGQEEQIAPYFKLDGKVLDLTYLNFTKKGMKLMVYNNGTDDLVFNENLAPTFSFHQALDLSKLGPGSYDAVLESSDNSYSYNIRLD